LQAKQYLYFKFDLVKPLKFLFHVENLTAILIITQVLYAAATRSGQTHRFIGDFLESVIIDVVTIYFPGSVTLTTWYPLSAKAGTNSAGIARSRTQATELVSQ
jgi:hypothetical protein